MNKQWLAVFMLLLAGCTSMEEDEGKTKPSTSNNSSALLSIKGDTVTEGRNLNSTITLTLSKKSSREVVVNLEYIDQSAVNGVDYIRPESEVRIAQGETVKKVLVPIIDNMIDEPDKTLMVRVASVTGADKKNVKEEALLTIKDDENEPVVSVPDSVRTIDENVGGVKFTVSLSNLSGYDINIPYSLHGTAAKNIDYIDDNEGILTIPSGSGSGVINLSIIEDQIREGGETVILRLQDPVHAGLSSSSVGTIIINGDALLNDTGVTKYRGNNDESLDSAPIDYPNQDAGYGRDLTDNFEGDGMAGFSFTKLDAAGNSLPYSSTSYRCLRDNVTGLLWEVKREDFDIASLLPNEERSTVGHTENYRAANYKYTWYVDNVANSGRSNGAKNDPFKSGRLFDEDGYCAFRKEEVSRSYELRCNTKSYELEVNRYGLCGSKRWRTPSISELKSIVNYDIENSQSTGVFMDVNVFKHVKQGTYLSSTPSAEFDASVWCVNTVTGMTGLCHKGGLNYLRLVSNAE